MSILKRLCLCLGMAAALLLIQAPLDAEASLDRKVLDLIGTSVYEVVVQKPTKDSLTYARPLPLDLLPYGERTDKYLSVGTAFALTPTEFVTASHVLALDRESQYKEYFIRDDKGAVYAIDKVVKYSDRRDFVVFTVKDRPAGGSLPLNTSPRLNDKVYAVGNALGEGIVIRDGLYTSNTPEDLQGEWKWLRFSAAASPGNSGGPLLDESGAVIGVILQKSPNENLNVALPIAEVLNAPKGVALIHRKMFYLLDNMSTTEIDVLRREVPLPKPYRQLNREITAIVDAFSADLLKRLFNEHKAQIFPNGKASLPLMYRSIDAVFPHLIVRGPDGIWDAQAAKETKEFEMGDNGSIILGHLGSSFFMYIQKPDDIPLTTFYNDSKVFMDTLLRGLGITRQIAVDKIKVTSFGKAREESLFVDGYQRKWLVRTWAMEYNDQRVVTFSLPVPGGCITVMRSDQTGRVNGHIVDLKTLSDFMYVSYYGSFKQWREFLAMGELLPQAFSAITIDVGKGERFAYKSARLAFHLGQENLQLSEDSDLKLNFGYFPEGKRTVWDVKEITVGEDKSSTTSFSLSRIARPASGLSDKYKSEWDKMVRRKMPYNRSAFLNDRSTTIATVYAGTGERPDAPTVLYHVGYTREGSFAQKEMETGLDGFLRNLTVYEDGGTRGKGAGGE